MQKEKQKQDEKMRKEHRDSERKVVGEDEKVSNEEWLCQSVGKESLERTGDRGRERGRGERKQGERKENKSSTEYQ